MALLIVALIIAALLFIPGFFFDLRVNRLRSSGQYPAKGQATDADVQRLVNRGDHILAIRCYREVHPGTGLAEAKKAVEKLQTASPA